MQPVWRFKIHELRRFGCQGLWQRSSSAQVLRDECWERLERDGRGRYWIRKGEGRTEMTEGGGERREERRRRNSSYSAPGFNSDVAALWEPPGNWWSEKCCLLECRADSRSAGCVLEKDLKARVRPSSLTCTGASCPRLQKRAWNAATQQAVGISSSGLSGNRKYRLR